MSAFAIPRSRAWEVGLSVGLLVAGFVVATTVATRSTARRTAAGVEWVVVDTATGKEPRILASSRREADTLFRAWTAAGGAAAAPVRVHAGSRSYYAAASVLPAGDGYPARRLVMIAPAEVEFSSGALVIVAAAVAGMLLVTLTGRRSSPDGPGTMAAARTPPTDSQARGHARTSVALSDGDLARVAISPQPDLLAADAPSSEERLVPGYLFADRYEILEMLGRSDVRTAYKVRDRESSTLVVLKTLHAGAFGGDASGVAQFKADLRVVRRLAHRNILRTYDFGEASVYYVTMELVDATPLHDLLVQEGRLGVSATIAIAMQASRALSVAHRERVLHRDIRPHSLLLDADGLLKVADFGLATTAQRTRALARSASADVIAYVPPEVLHARAVDARSDLYSLAVVLYQCIAGRLPNDVVEPLSSIDPTVPRGFSDLISETLSFQPALRPATAEEFRHRLILDPAATQ